MIAKDLPKCICGEHNYGGGGGYCGGGLSYTNFECNNCKRGVMELHPWLFFDRDTGLDHTVMSDYVNNVILPFRRELEEKKMSANVPPQIPEQLVVYYYNGKRGHDEVNWRLVDWVESSKLPLPVDPIAVKHKEFWASTVKSTGAREVPNQYYEDRGNKEPWYQFTAGDATVTFGPRKRVLAIKVTRDTPFGVKNIAELAKEADTSYWADDHWHDWDAEEAKDIHIHAWNKEKFDAYLATIMFDLGATMYQEQTKAAAPPA